VVSEPISVSDVVIIASNGTFEPLQLIPATWIEEIIVRLMWAGPDRTMAQHSKGSPACSRDSWEDSTRCRRLNVRVDE